VKPEVQPEPPPEPPTLSSHHLSVGVALGSLTLNDDDDAAIAFYPDTNQDRRLQLGYAFGEEWRFGMQAGLAVSVPTTATGHDIGALEGGVVAARAFRVGRAIEAETVVAAGLRAVSFAGAVGANGVTGTSGIYTVPVDIGERVHVYLADRLSLWGGIGYRMDFAVAAASPITRVVIDSSGVTSTRAPASTARRAASAMRPRFPSKSPMI
jgi:hypothetical protein